MNEEQIKTIGKILLGAAFSDGHADGSELDAIVDILEAFVGGALPEGMVTELEAFDWHEFDVKAACESLALQTSDDRRALLVLVAEIIEADEMLDNDEEAYVRMVARYLNAKPAEYMDLV